MNKIIGLIALISVGVMVGQQTTMTAGGLYAAGSGSINYSIGVICLKGVNGEALSGVQQPFEIITVITSAAGETVSLAPTAGPNPATQEVTLTMNGDVTNTSYVFVRLSGETIQTKPVQQGANIINIETLTPGMYMLSVFKNGAAIKSFKIIKR